MEKELFLKGMQELLEVAKAGGGKIRKEDILSYFGGLDITDEIETMLCDYFVEAGVQVEGYDRSPKKEQRRQNRVSSGFMKRNWQNGVDLTRRRSGD